MTIENCAWENRDCNKIVKLNQLTDKETFWDDVRKLTRNVTSDHAIHRWQCLAERRWNELITGCEDVISEVEYGKPTRYYDRAGKEVFATMQTAIKE